jgi:hypothetical protein
MVLGHGHRPPCSDRQDPQAGSLLFAHVLLVLFELDLVSPDFGPWVDLQLHGVIKTGKMSNTTFCQAQAIWQVRLWPNVPSLPIKLWIHWPHSGIASPAYQFVQLWAEMRAD